MERHSIRWSLRSLTTLIISLSAHPSHNSTSCHRANTFVKMALPPKVYQVGNISICNPQHALTYGDSSWYLWSHQWAPFSTDTILVSSQRPFTLITLSTLSTLQRTKVELSFRCSQVRERRVQPNLTVKVQTPYWLLSGRTSSTDV